MSNLDQPGGTYSYNGGGTNTPTQVTANACILYHVSVSHNGGSVGYLQFYNNGTYDVEGAGGTVIGTPDFVVAVHAGTAAAGTPTFQAARDVVFGPYGRQLNGGLTYLWANAATGTAAFAGNAIVDITLSKVT